MKHLNNVIVFDFGFMKILPVVTIIKAQYKVLYINL